MCVYSNYIIYMSQTSIHGFIVFTHRGLSSQTSMKSTQLSTQGSVSSLKSARLFAGFTKGWGVAKLKSHGLIGFEKWQRNSALKCKFQRLEAVLLERSFMFEFIIGQIIEKGSFLFQLALDLQMGFFQRWWCSAGWYDKGLGSCFAVPSWQLVDYQGCICEN